MVLKCADQDIRNYAEQMKYIAKKVEQVKDTLTEIIQDIDYNTEEVTALRLNICKSWLDNLMIRLSRWEGKEDKR